MTFTIIIRSLIIYLIVLFLLRLMGKRQIGEMQPFELVITLVIADLATIPMAETSLPLIHGIIPLLTLVCVHYLLSLLSRKSRFCRKIISGKPIILIDPDGIDFDALRNLNMNFNDLMESLRACNYFNLEEILYAIIQTNGAMVVVPRAPFAPLTADDVGISKSPAALPMIIISKGKVVKENIIIAKLTEDKLKNWLKESGAGKLNEIMLATIDQNGNMYIQPQSGSFVSYQANYDGGENW